MQKFANNFETTVAAELAADGTSLEVAAGAGATLVAQTGTLSAADYCVLCLYHITAGVETDHEYVKVTGRAADTLTIVRGGATAEGTTARVWHAGDRVSARLTKHAADGVLQHLLAAAKGDLAAASAAGVMAALGVGANDEVLQAQSAQAFGMLWAAMAAGTDKVKQVVVATTTTQRSVTSVYNNNPANLNDTYLTGKITPASTDNRILVIAAQQLMVSRGSGDYTGAYCMLYRMTTSYNLRLQDTRLTFNANGMSAESLEEMQFFLAWDTPPTAAEQTYKCRMAVEASGDTVYSQNGSRKSVMILIEFAP